MRTAAWLITGADGQRSVTVDSHARAADLAARVHGSYEDMVTRADANAYVEELKAYYRRIIATYVAALPKDAAFKPD